MKAIALGPDGRIAEHDLRLPKGVTPIAMRYCQGQFFVMYRTHSTQNAYWSGNATDVFEVEMSWGFPALGLRAFELEDGGITEGKEAYYAGDRKGPEASTASSDGTNVWRTEWGTNGREMREFNPKTGAVGRASMPSFIAEYTRDGMEINPMRSWLLPLPKGVTSSILGSNDGLMGLRVREHDWNSPLKGSVPSAEFESISGHTLTLQKHSHDIEAFLPLPGSGQALPVEYDAGYNAMGTTKLYQSDGKAVVGEASPSTRGYAMGTHTVLPPLWWNLYQIRSEEDLTHL